MLATDESMRPISDAIDPHPEPLKIHCFDPWWIVKAKSNSEAKAKRALEREHFEVYYGERKEFVSVTIPARKISSKTRYRRRSEKRIIERVRPVYPGYLFVRRLFGGFDLSRAFELDGVLGLCCFGEIPASVPDYMIELLRLAEARGKFDTRSHSQALRDIRAAEKERKANNKGIIGPRTLGRIDEANGSIVFMEEFGRITRIITAPVG